MSKRTIAVPLTYNGGESIVIIKMSPAPAQKEYSERVVSCRVDGKKIPRRATVLWEADQIGNFLTFHGNHLPQRVIRALHRQAQEVFGRKTAGETQPAAAVA